MKNNVETLNRLTVQLEKAREDLEQINKEEELLEFEQSEFPILMQMFQAKDPYDKLWTTALSFSEKSSEWLSGIIVIFTLSASLFIHPQSCQYICLK